MIIREGNNRREIDTCPPRTIVGRTLEDFMRALIAESDDRTYVFFHNLAFDGMFILYWLIEQNVYCTDGEGERDKTCRRNSRVRRRMNTYSTLINRGGFYKIDLRWDRGSKNITIRDSLKLFPGLAIRDLGEALDGDMRKGDIDHTIFRPEGYEPTEEEWGYVTRDVEILDAVLNHADWESLTLASSAMKDYKSLCPRVMMNFPRLDADIDRLIRPAYHGGFTEVNKAWLGRAVHDVTVVDKNSMYPEKLLKYPLPYGKEMIVTDIDEIRDIMTNGDNYLWVMTADVSFNLKPGSVPCIPDGRSVQYGEENLTCEDSITLSFSSVDYNLYQQMYDFEINSIEFFCFWKSRAGLFTHYIEKWRRVKEENSHSAKPGARMRRLIAKLYLNSLYGKFGTGLHQSKQVFMTRAGERPRFRSLPPEDVKGVYLPVAIFVTSYAKNEIVTAAHSLGERFIYTDTDSLHFVGDLPDLDYDSKRIGAWDVEKRLSTAVYNARKQYAYRDSSDGSVHRVVAGCSGDLPDGFAPEDLLHPQQWPIRKGVRVKGGKIIENTLFTYRPRVV